MYLNDENDEELIRHYSLHQSNLCFTTLYSRYASKVYKKCLSITKNKEQAQDFTHDIFLKAFANLNAFQERSSFSTWLYAIAFNYCSDQLRLAKRLPTITLEGSPAYFKAESMEIEMVSGIKHAMERLPNQERQLLQLKYEENLTLAEIAQRYNLGISAVKMRLKRSREKLQQLYVVQLRQE